MEFEEFDGTLKEIPYIKVDNFITLNSDAYFLSHCHTDHMFGLRDSRFQDMLLEKNVFLYASEVSCLILQNMYKRIRNHLRILNMYSPTFVQLRDRTISVMPISAGHCPGSVMFLFESIESGNILYTGDYRINPRDFKKIKAFYDPQTGQKVIENIYLDTTFFLKSYLKFPSRDESLRALNNVVKSWIELDKNNYVVLSTSAKYGYEFLFLELYKKFGIPVHVSQETFDNYKYLPELNQAVTRDGSNTVLHCQYKKSETCIRETSKECNIKEIRISSLTWKNADLESDIVKINENGNVKLCYSTHASFEEGAEFIRFLKPKKIKPCVQQRKREDNLEMHQLIQEILQEINETAHKDCNITNQASQKTEIVTLFEVTPESITNNLRICHSKAEYVIETNRVNESQEYESALNLLDSPPRKQFKE